jgi:hypothetical protein
MISRMTTIVPTPMYIDDLPPGLTTPLIALISQMQTTYSGCERRHALEARRPRPGDCDTFSTDEH